MSLIFGRAKRGDNLQKSFGWSQGNIPRYKEVTSPAASEPETKFKVLEEEKLNELALIRSSSRSHLALGIFYARAGMIAEAERELQLLLSENRGSVLAARLLRSVRSWR